VSNWEHASENELKAAREAYLPSDPKSPDYVGSRPPPSHERKEHMQELATIETQDIAWFRGDPAERIQHMRETAAILAGIIKDHWTVKIQGRDYVLIEGWTTLGAMVGVHPFLEWSRPVSDETGKHVGWEARVLARKDRTLEVVSAAEAQCLSTEQNWKGRDDYAIRSMAQTRAQAKALKSPLMMIISLAGFETTPAEEMPASSFQPPTVEEKRRLMFSLRDRLIRAGVIEDEQAFTDQIKAEYGKHPGTLNSVNTGEIIGRLTTALEKQHEKGAS
jgi:hypothetical protein